MGIKKYEIITVGSDKRVRALRSWQVQDRYVNIGDVGGIVYDEKTLSQDGACWLFRGNFNFPGARIGGDSVVDVGETTLSANGSPNVDILGTSTLVGSPVRFSSDQTAADAVTLAEGDFEQGTFSYTAGTNWETWKVSSANQLRTKNPIFAGGVATTLKLDVPGYTVQAFALDRDGNGIGVVGGVNTGAGVTLVVPAGQYFVLRLLKNPVEPIVPADATAAQIKFTGTYETKLVVVDSRIALNPANSTGTATIRPGGTYNISSGAKYFDSVIRDSIVSINVPANRDVRFMAELVNVNAKVDITSVSTHVPGMYSNVKNLVFNDLSASVVTEAARPLIQAYNCDNMVVNTTNFPGLAAMQTAGVPIKFYSCNLIEGRFYHHAQIANTYRDINFDLATKDLGKTFDTDRVLVSSEVNGMYRAWFATDFGALIESHESVKSLTGMHVGNSYNTTIYADAYLNGAITFVGTNVIGNTMKHDASNTQNVLAVQGMFNAITVGGVISGIVAAADRVVVAQPYRINGSSAFTVNNDTDIETQMLTIDPSGKIINLTSWAVGTRSLTIFANRIASKVYIAFRKAGGAPITPDDVKGITVTTYNGCRIINTKATGAVISGNVRVEDNATLIDTSVTGTGYFGGNSIIQAPSALVGQLPIEGAAYMSDNAVFAPSTVNASAGLSLLEMKDNAVFAGNLTGASTNYNITMADNSKFLGSHGSRNGFIMRGNSFVAAAGAVASACRGLLIMKDDARIELGDLTAIGYITLCGKYNQTATKTWTGKRVIDSQDAPLYDNNVKTKYDI